MNASTTANPTRDLNCASRPPATLGAVSFHCLPSRLRGFEGKKHSPTFNGAALYDFWPPCTTFG
jgi:hypothetical protein